MSFEVTANVEVDPNSRGALRIAYRDLVGHQPDRRWSVATLQDKIAAHKATLKAQADREAQAEREREAARIEREARIVRRGEWDVFAKTYRNSEDEDDQRYARAARWAQSIIENHEKVATELAEKFASDPAYTMSWGMTYFSHAADYKYALEVKKGFENGATAAGLASYFTRDLLHKAAYPARSTSPTSNLVEQEELRAVTKLVGYLDGTEFF